LPLQTTGDAYDVAEAVAFLASAPFVTGVTLRVDGGEGLI
jgi:NAD(P)-dependent dehydrogenase (short-subunit alcohol dehydrogenase family)